MHRMRKLLSILTIAAAGWAGAGCELRQAMYDQPKVKPLAKSEFFADGRGARPLVEGTVARGHLNDDEHLFTGKVNGELATTFPEPVTREVLARGQERYNIFCAPCHDLAGTGTGMIVQRGFKKPVSFHDPRLVASTPGYYFQNITVGFGQMPSYADQIPVKDRWAIVAYIRALQRSRMATMDDVPVEEREKLLAGSTPQAGQAH